MNISQESDTKSQDEIPVLSSYGKNLECYVRERYLKKISVAGHTEREVQLRIFASCRSLGLAFLFSFGDNLLQLFRFVSSAQGENGKQNCCGQGEKFAANERSSCEHLDHWRESVHRNYLVGKYSGNC